METLAAIPSPAELTTILPVASGVTVSEYLDLPDDGHRYELIDGVLFVVPPPYANHQRFEGELTYILSRHVRAHGLGEVLCSRGAVSIGAASLWQPDILFIPKHHPQFGKNVQSFTRPELVVEILSPSSRAHDRRMKFAAYEEAGIPNYWIVDPESRAFEAWTARAGKYARSAIASLPDAPSFAAPPFADLVIDLNAVFTAPGRMP